MGRSNYKFADVRLPHFITCTAVAWIPLFARPEAANIVLNSLRYLSQNGMKLYAYVLLENHLHLIAQSEKLDKHMASFKSYTARQIIDFLRETGGDATLRRLASGKKTHKNDRDYQVWEEGMHPVCMETPKMTADRVNYIHHNPVRRGYVDEAEDWRYSSARNYSGRKGLLEVCTEW